MTTEINTELGKNKLQQKAEGNTTAYGSKFSNLDSATQSTTEQLRSSAQQDQSVDYRTAEQARDGLRKAEKSYNSKDRSPEELLNQYEKIINSSAFNQLTDKEKSIIYNRAGTILEGLAYSQSARLIKSAEEHNVTPALHSKIPTLAEFEAQKSKFETAREYLKNSVLTDPTKEESRKALVVLGEHIVEIGIGVGIEVKSSDKLADELKKIGTLAVSDAVDAGKYNGTLITDSLTMVFPNSLKSESFQKIFGLIKHSGDVSEDKSLKFVVDNIGGLQYNIEEKVLPWINDVYDGKIVTTIQELTFITELQKLGFITFDKNGIFKSTGKSNSLILMPFREDPLDEERMPRSITHEFGHRAYYGSRRFRELAEICYQDAKKNKEAFSEFYQFVSQGNSKIPLAAQLSEYFAYGNSLYPYFPDLKKVKGYRE